MLRQTLIATFLLGASGSALALDDFLSRHRLEPHVSITLSSGHRHDVHQPRHREVYYRDVYRDVYVPRPVYVQPVYHNSYYRSDEGRHHWKHKNKHQRQWRDYDRDDHHDRRRHHRYHDDD